LRISQPAEITGEKIKKPGVLENCPKCDKNMSRFFV
jgi:hypothetical protein